MYTLATVGARIAFGQRKIATQNRMMVKLKKLGTLADPGNSGTAREPSKDHWPVGSNARRNER
jgi:hypothetical protein